LLVCAILKGINISYKTQKETVEFETVDVLNQEVTTGLFQNKDTQELRKYTIKKKNAEDFHEF
jgi:hypothetical protein